jgi:molybdopterin converting factor subunit 1
MNVSVKLFAVARERAGADAVAVELPNGATVRELRHALVERHPALSDVIAHARLAVNNEYASDATPLSASAEVALIPPVSGG